MGTHNISTPRGSIVNTGRNSCELVWNPTFGQTWSGHFNDAQAVIDSEVLRYDAPLVPLRTGMLMKSGELGTVIGSGEVDYIAPYAAHQYYDTADSRWYDSNRGAHWFERMKTAHKEDILRAARSKGGII